jgi:serine/threonine-protein kinase HipA
MDETGYALAPFYDLLCVQVYGDDRLSLYIGDEDQYASVGAHSWEAFCDDCGFSLRSTMTLFRKIAQDVAKAWGKVTAQATTDFVLSQQELGLIQSMTQVIDTHCAAALSMTTKR